MMIFAQCHSSKDIWLLSCCVVSAELPFDQQNKLKFPQSDWFLNQFQNFLVELRTCLGRVFACNVNLMMVRVSILMRGSSRAEMRGSR